MNDNEKPKAKHKPLEGERVQKALASAGYGSRRQLEAQIKDRKISINGSICSLGDRVSPGDKIRIDGRLIALDLNIERRRRVLAYHKPEGVVTTRSDPEGRPTVFDHLPYLKYGRWVVIGRLDINTSGLLLLTTDGELANKLMHPSSEIEREYAVRVLGEVKKETMEALHSGVDLEDGIAKFDTVLSAGGEGANRWYNVTLKEGRNREVRRLWEAVGHTVSRLTRTRYGIIELNRRLARGRWEELDFRQVNSLAKSVGLNPQSPPKKKHPDAPGARRTAKRISKPRSQRSSRGKPKTRSGTREGR